jgi:hypothetical protein
VGAPSVRIGATNMRWMFPLLAVLLGACLIGAGSHDTNAYFSDARSGTMTGTIACPPPACVPIRFVPGKSKALHWGCDCSGSAAGAPIARVDGSGTMTLDFGEAPAGHGDTRPDVFRIVSLVDDSRIVDFRVDGPMCDFVTEVSLEKSACGVLPGRATRRVRFDVRIPHDASAGAYAGTLVVRVQGWAQEARIPMTIAVCDTKAKAGAQQGCLPVPSQATSGTAVPSVSVSDSPTPAPIATTPEPTSTPPSRATTPTGWAIGG